MIAALTARLLLNSAQFQAALNRAVIQAGSAAQNMSAQFNGLKNLAVFGSLGLAVGELGQKIISSTVELEKYKRQLVIISGGSESAAVKMRELREAAALPGLDLASAVDGQVRLQTMGYTADEATQHIKTLAKNVAAFGGGGNEMKGIILAFSQISSKGQVFAEEINQIAERLPTVRQLMKEAFGTSNAEELQKMGMSAKEFTDRMIAGMEDAQPVTAGLQEEMTKLKLTWNSLFADDSGSVAKTVGWLNSITQYLKESHEEAVTFYSGLIAGEENVKKLKEWRAWAAKKEEEVGNQEAKMAADLAEKEEAEKKRLKELITAREAYLKAISDSVSRAGMLGKVETDDEGRLGVVNNEIKRIMRDSTPDELIDKLRLAQEGFLELSEAETAELQRYLGLLDQRKSLEESIAKDKEAAFEKAEEFSRKEAEALQRRVSLQDALNKQVFDQSDLDDDARLNALNEQVEKTKAEELASKLNDAKERGLTLGEKELEQIQEALDLLGERDDLQQSITDKQTAIQKAEDKQMFDDAFERAGMNRDERVSAIRAKNDAKRQASEASRSLLRDEMKRLKDEGSVTPKFGQTMKDAIKEQAKLNLSKKANNDIADSSQSLKDIKTILAGFAAA
jgi:tape measure domain-containing protein